VVKRSIANAAALILYLTDGAAVGRGQVLNVRGIAFGGGTDVAKVLVSVAHEAPGVTRIVNSISISR